MFPSMRTKNYLKGDENNRLCLNGPIRFPDNQYNQPIVVLALVYVKIIGLLVLKHFQYSQMCFLLRFDEIFY